MDMRPQMARFENQLQGQADVVRVDFNSNRALAMQCGADICPSYVLFRDGRRVRTYRYPVSVDLLVADLAANSKEHRGTGRSEVSYQQ